MNEKEGRKKERKIKNSNDVSQIHFIGTATFLTIHKNKFRRVSEQLIWNPGVHFWDFLKIYKNSKLLSRECALKWKRSRERRRNVKATRNIYVNIMLLWDIIESRKNYNIILMEIFPIPIFHLKRSESLFRTSSHNYAYNEKMFPFGCHFYGF